jgi:hypothetical protein
MDQEEVVPSTADAANYNRGVGLRGGEKMQSIAVGVIDGKRKMSGRERCAVDGKG